MTTNTKVKAAIKALVDLKTQAEMKLELINGERSQYGSGVIMGITMSISKLQEMDGE